MEKTVHFLETTKDFFLVSNPNLSRWKTIDFCLFYLVIPSILWLFYAVPQGFKNNYLVLHPANVTLSSLLLSNYTHTNLIDHLLPNLLFYFLFTYLIFNLETRKRLFYITMGFLFVPVAVAVSVVSINLPFLFPNIQGFSVIVSGLMGYSIYATYTYIRNVENVGIDRSIIVLIFLINALLVVINISGLQAMWFILAILALVAFLCAVNRAGIRDLVIFLNKKSLKIKSVSRITIIFWWVLFIIEITALTGLVFIIPRNPIVGTMITNSLGHYLGYCFGLLFPVVLDTAGLFGGGVN